ncbi:DNA polymerase III subunit delta' [Rheinheimera soli]|uniref:DNA-directed DNA polymerase n=1 Tax=Rheinheimera soli TaxID=443616 RepID=A0ABU1W240_9GAMM|nr:DNA polymerase III subunit delta' [Rheinheimera soli]MDR7122011.1 DNA polymerase-3 subunit delta' [Rheinheimera soli]
MSDFPWLDSYQYKLTELAEAGQLHHAILLTGPVGIGKLALSKRLAAYLLCKSPQKQLPCGLCKSCQLMASGHHPDLWQLPTEGSSSIGVDPIRALGQFMQGASQQGGVKLALIPHAELMTEAAANALLKTLEEPPQNSFLIVQSAHPAQLLPTILSRCQSWALAPVYGEQIEHWLQEHSSRPVPDFLLQYVGGAPLLALKLLENDEAAAISAQLVMLKKFVSAQLDMYELLAHLPDTEQLASTLFWFVRQELWNRGKEMQLKHHQLLVSLQQWGRDRQLITGQNAALNLSALLVQLRSALL